MYLVQLLGVIELKMAESAPAPLAWGLTCRDDYLRITHAQFPARSVRQPWTRVHQKTTIPRAEERTKMAREMTTTAKITVTEGNFALQTETRTGAIVVIGAEIGKGRDA